MEEKFEFERFLELFATDFADLVELLNLAKEGNSLERVEKVFLFDCVPILAKMFEQERPEAMQELRNWAQIGFEANFLQDVLRGEGLDEKTIWLEVIILKWLNGYPDSGSPIIQSN